MPFFENAQNIDISGGNFVNYVQVHYHGPNGLQILLSSSLPEAAHDSSAQETAPSCLPGTREQYISDIAGWVRSHSTTRASDGAEEGLKPAPRLLWFNGPFGVGKSAIARTCAEILGGTSELGAAFFFSRSNKRDNPTKLFTTIAYQLATRLRPNTSPYGAYLEEKIRKDSSVLMKTIDVQLNELIVGPVLHLLKEGSVRHQPPVLIIVDGLDECNGPQSQCKIIRLISQITMVHPSLPLLWAVFSRPEPHIKSTIRAYSALWWEISLQVSNDSYKDIELYLRNNFARIHQQYNLSSSLDQGWPSDPDIKVLVEKSDGLFIYAATVIRFFDDPELPERERELFQFLYPKRRAISALNSTTGVLTPLSHLDAFYTAIMERIRPQHLTFTLNVLLVLSGELFTSDLSLTRVRCLLGYSDSTMQSAIYCLHSVLFLRNKGQRPETRTVVPGPAVSAEQMLGFYHYSFVEFLRSPSRSGKFYVLQPTCQVYWASRCLEILSRFSEAGGLEDIQLPHPVTGDPEEIKELRKSLLLEASYSLLKSCARIKTLSDHSNLILQLYSLDFRKIVAGIDASKQHLVMCIREEELRDLMKQLSQYNQNKPWSQRMPRLIRERLQVMNIVTQQYHNFRHIVNSALCTRTNSYESISSSASASDSSLHSIGSSVPSTPSRVLPTYELGQPGKVIYLYPEKSASGVTYHVSMSSDNLEEPYVFSDNIDVID